MSDNNLGKYIDDFFDDLELYDDKYNGHHYKGDAIRYIPKLLDNIGLKIIRSRLRALTYKMNQFYEYGKLDSNSSGEKEFRALNTHIQFCNLRQANHIVKLLKDKGYEFASIDDIGEPVESFDYDEIEYFAKRVHEGWYKLKLNLNETSSRNFVDGIILTEKSNRKIGKLLEIFPTCVKMSMCH